MSGRFDAPGDKSVSHRSFILAALANGISEIHGCLESEDVLNTAKAVAALGADIEQLGNGSWKVTGTSGTLRTPNAPLDFGNAGTGVRLMMGAIAGAGIAAEFVGDISLSSRPMARVTNPLSDMGAVFETSDGRLPAKLSPSSLTAIDYTPPIASAQVKSAILLAGLGATGETIVRESHATRDHTEKMFKAFGVKIESLHQNGGLIVKMTGPQSLTACDINVPGDPSSAAFAIVAALITPGSSIQIDRVMDNPARDGIYQTLQEMGAKLEITPGPVMAGEKTVSIKAEYSKLKGIDVPADRAPSMIDEYPVLSVAAANAIGITRMAGLAELRAKESDRLNGTYDMLNNNGVTVEKGEDSLTIHGGSVPGGGVVATHHDHRLAMSGLVLGMSADKPVTIDDANMIATSYPDFFDHMKSIGASLEFV